MFKLLTRSQLFFLPFVSSAEPEKNKTRQIFEKCTVQNEEVLRNQYIEHSKRAEVLILERTFEDNTDNFKLDTILYLKKSIVFNQGKNIKLKNQWSTF